MTYPDGIILQQYNLLKNNPYEDMITCPIMIDGQSVRQRLREQHRRRLVRERRLEAQTINEIKKALKTLLKWSFYALAYPVKYLSLPILYGTIGIERLINKIIRR